MMRDNIYRTARSGSEWTDAQLEDYNITIDYVNAENFFGQNIDNVTLEEVPSSILTCQRSNDILDDEDPGYYFLRLHDLVISGTEESVVDDFAQELLRIMKFRQSRRIILSHKRLDLIMCGTKTIAETDVCVTNNDNILLLVQEDKAYRNTDNPEPQLIAEAIAAFQYNNKIRKTNFNKDPLTSYTFPCVTMIGSHARFYRIPITESLNMGIKHGYKPEQVTNVKCYNPLKNIAVGSLGMFNLEDRKKFLQCFKLMRQIMIEQAEQLN